MEPQVQILVCNGGYFLRILFPEDDDVVETNCVAGTLENCLEIAKRYLLMWEGSGEDAEIPPKKPEKAKK